MLQAPYSLQLPRSRAYPLAFLALSFIWGLFVFSALENYQTYSWYVLLLISRVGLSFSALGLCLYCFVKKSYPKNLLFYFLIICEYVQALFSILEGPFAVAFSEYVGILFFMASFVYRSSFQKWKKKWALVQLFPFFLLFLFKDTSLLWPLGQFVHHFSFIVVGIGLGIVILRLNADRFSMLEKNTALQEKILKREIQEKNNTQHQLNFVRQIAHDLKAPLAVLKLVLRKSDFNNNSEHECDDNIKLISQVVTRIEKINSLLLSEFKNFQSDNSHETSLAHLLQGVELLMKEKYFLLGSHSVNFKIIKKFENQNRRVKISESDFLRVISNLYDNSIEALKKNIKDSFIRLHFEESSQSLGVTVEDNGCGIPQNVVHRVFEEGFSFNKNNGHGIGLFSAKQILEKNGGTLTLVSELNRGTKAHLSLPLCSDFS
jgi:signal transduction histidine kinase